MFDLYCWQHFFWWPCGNCNIFKNFFQMGFENIFLFVLNCSCLYFICFSDFIILNHWLICRFCIHLFGIFSIIHFLKELYAKKNAFVSHFFYDSCSGRMDIYFFFLVLQSMTGVSKDYLFQVYQISYVCYFTTSGVYLHDV